MTRRLPRDVSTADEIERALRHVLEDDPPAGTVAVNLTGRLRTLGAYPMSLFPNEVAEKAAPHLVVMALADEHRALRARLRRQAIDIAQGERALDDLRGAVKAVLLAAPDEAGRLAMKIVQAG